MRTTCLDDLELIAFVDGGCTASARAEICDHIETCEVCREVLAELLGTAARTAVQRPRGRVAGQVDRGPDAEIERAPTRLPFVVDGYRVEQLVAEGGMGRVYRARDLELGREVALKIPLSTEPTLVHRFEREVAISAQLQHPGVVPVHGTGTLTDGTRFYVMRYVDGTGLDVAVELAASPAERLALLGRVVSVVETMAYVHAQGIAHRDLKPNNVLVSRFGETIIIDWGLAKQVRGEDALRLSAREIEAGPEHRAPIAADERARRLLTTRFGSVLGTPAFMAPEQAAGEPVDLRADVYALGSILRYVVTGTHDASRAKTMADDVPPAIVAVWTRAMAHERAERFAHAGELLPVLRDAVASLAPKLPALKRRWRYGLAAVAIALASGGVAIGLGAQRAGRPAAQPGLIPLGSLPPQTRAIAASPRGGRIAYATLERVEVRDVATGQRWSRVGWTQAPAIVQFTAEDTVEYAAAAERHGTRHHVRWVFTRDAAPDPGRALDGNWFGSYAGGDLHSRGRAQDLAVVTADRVLALPTYGREPIAIAAAAPGRRRFAYVDPQSLHSSVIRVVDEAGRVVATSPRVDDLTALAWLDDEVLVYAVGSQAGSTVVRVEASPEGLAQPVIAYRDVSEARTIGALAGGGGRLFAMVTAASSETRILDRETNTSALGSSAADAVSIAWRDAAAYYAYDRATGNVELRSLDERVLPVTTGTILRGDPASATRAGEILIVALRATGGRRVEAYAVGEQAPRWHRAAGELTFVRCAADATEPCVAGLDQRDGSVEVRRIDPRSGALGELVAAADAIGDVALDASGTQLALITGTTIVVRPLGASSPGRRIDALSLPRSVAFDPRGGLIVSASNDVTPQIVSERDGRVETLARVPAGFVSLVRPSPDGAHVSFRTRVFTSELAELRLGGAE